MTCLHIGELETSLEEFAHVGVERVHACITSRCDDHEQDYWPCDKLPHRYVLLFGRLITLRFIVLLVVTLILTLSLLLALLLLLTMHLAVDN